MSILEPARRTLARATYARPYRDPAFIAGATALGPSGKSFEGAPADAALPSSDFAAASVITGYDAVTADNLPAGAGFYAGYYDGRYANLSAIRAAHPGVPVASVTPDGTRGAMYIDVEPGCCSNDDIVPFLLDGGLGFYTMGSNLEAAIAACAAAGIKRDSYKAWSAHWTGRHICGTATCGYPPSDGTQYASNDLFDTDDVDPDGFFGDSPAPVVPEMWKYEAPQGLTARGGHTTAYLSWDSPKYAVGGAAVPKPLGYQIDIYRNPPVITGGIWELVETRSCVAPRDQVGSLDRGASYLAHVWALGSPASSQRQYASVPILTGGRS